MIEYKVSISNPHSHILRIEMQFEVPTPDCQVSIPAWTPGSYLVREFSRFLGELSATDADGASCEVRKVAKGTWNITAPTAGTRHIHYDVYAHELSVRTPHVDGTHAFFTGSNAFLFVHGRTDESTRVSIAAPDGWLVFSGLASIEHTRTEFDAENYDILADSIFEIGPHRHHDFEVLGVPHRMVFWGGEMVNVDVSKLETDTRRAVEANAQLFGGVLPYPHYLFVFHITASGRGGLEHLNSTALATPWKYFDTTEGHLEMMGLIAHEHFHVWNVKRVRPLALGPFDYLGENYTTGLWVAEGFTSYYDNLNCLRSGICSVDEYLAAFSKDISRYFQTPGRFEQSVAASSYDAWIRLYRPDDNFRNRTVSYYLKGALIAAAIDFSIRDATEAKHSLDDLLGALWRDFLSTGAGFDDSELPARIRKICNLGDDIPIEEWVFGTQDPQFDRILGSHGLELRTVRSSTVSLGLEFSSGSDLVVQTVLSDGPSAGQAIYAGDQIVAISGRRVNNANLQSMLGALRAGEPCPVHVFRRDQLHQVYLTPGTPPIQEWQIRRREVLSERESMLLRRWSQLPAIAPIAV